MILAYTIDDFYDERQDKPKKKKKEKEKRYQFSNNEEALIYLANNHKLKKSKKFKLKKYQRIDINIYDRVILDTILKEFKFKDIGNIYDYKGFIIDNLDSYNGLLDYSLCNKIGISKKHNSLVMYNKESWCIHVKFFIDIKHMEEFCDLVSRAMSEDDANNSLKNENFSCDDNSFLELVDSKKDNTKEFDLIRKKLYNENLIFDEKSVLNKIKKDVKSFFTDKTKNLYNKLEIPFKRGIILYGEPGNGKSSMIREIIRELPNNIVKVTIKNTRQPVIALSSLINALKGKEAIVIMEDIDSMINMSNRSDFLNTIDGMEINSGLYLIATTNYPERLDSGIFNRAGRFDKAYEICNPNKETRKLFFESRNELFSILDEFEFSKNNPNVTNAELVKTFVKYSNDVPMATLKEIITQVTYSLVYNEEKYILDAIKKTYNDIMSSRKEHSENRNNYLNNTMINNVPNQYQYGTVIPFETVKVKEELKEQKEENKKHIVTICRKKKEA